jgi:hypothetical protein
MSLAAFESAPGFESSEHWYSFMNKLGFDDCDYSIVVKNRAPAPNSWRWEIYRAGRGSPIKQSPVFFRTMAAANKAGKLELKQLLAKLNT